MIQWANGPLEQWLMHPSLSMHRTTNTDPSSHISNCSDLYCLRKKTSLFASQTRHQYAVVVMSQ